jgi:plastocyanin
MRRRSIAAWAAVAFVAILAGCTTGPPTPSGTPVKTSFVSIPPDGAFVFSPEVIEVPQGANVTWRNNGTVAHTVTFQTPTFSVVLQPGHSTFHVFNQSGTFDYVCTFHHNMVGRVIVDPISD